MRDARYAPAACLNRFAAGHHVEGVGQFWTARPLAAYSDDAVRILQVSDGFRAYPWLTNLATYRNARPTFVLIGTRDVWTTPVQDVLGDPARIVRCTGYDIYDYAGEPGARRLRRLVVDSRRSIATVRGFGR